MLQAFVMLKLYLLGLVNISVVFLVLRSVQSLRKVITDNDYNLVYSKYYSMFRDFQTGEQIPGDWEMFMKASLKLLGFPESSLKSLKVTLIHLLKQKMLLTIVGIWIIYLGVAINVYSCLCDWRFEWHLYLLTFTFASWIIMTKIHVWGIE